MTNVPGGQNIKRCFQCGTCNVGCPVREIEEKYPEEKVAIVDSSGYQYILTAWYLQTSPQQFFETIVKQLPDRIGFKYGEQLTHYHFIANASDRDETETVLVEWVDNQWQFHQF